MCKNVGPGIVIIALLATLLVGCNTPGPQPPEQPAAAPTPTASAAPTPATDAANAAAAAQSASSGSAVLKMARAYEPFSTFIPWHIDDNPAVLLSVNIYDTLIRASADGTALEPALATEWQAAEGGLSWTFTLREGVKFSDGAALSAEDVKASLDAVRSSEKSAWSSNYTTIKDIEIVDPQTVKVNLTEPSAAMPALLALFAAGILPADLVQASEAANFDPATAWQTRGTGAYKVDGWTKGEPIVLTVNPNYWQGKPAVDEIRIEYAPDDNARSMKLQRGEVDLIDFVPLSQLQALDDRPNITARPFTTAQMTFIMLNNEKQPLDDVKVRQALNYATDKAAINEAAYFGFAEFANAPIPPGMYQAAGLAGYPFEVDKARQLLAESSAPNGFDLEVQVRSGNTEYASVAAIIKQQWAEIGVNVHIVTLQTGAIRTNYQAGAYQAMPIGWTNDTNDPSQVANYALRGGEGTQYASWTRYNNPALNDMITRADLEMDPVKRAALYHEIQRIFQEAAPVVWLGYPPATAAWGDHVAGFSIETLGYYRFENVKVNP